MNCSQVREYFDEYYNSELNSETKNLVQQHLNECKECSSEYSAFLELKKQAASLKKEVMPPKQIFEKIEKELSGKNKMKTDIKITPLSNNILTIDFNEEKKSSAEQKPQNFLGRNWYWIATAAVFLLIVSVVFMNYSSKNVFSVEEMSNWKLISLKGGAIVNGVRTEKVNVGDWIQTDSVSSVILKIANVGDVSIEPNTKVRFIQSDNNVSRIEVLYGTVNTTTSQADKFILQSSNMKVQDKGGSYSFKVDDKGNGVIYVNNGIANVESGNKSAVVTDGKFCLYKPEFGVGIPFRKDSKPEFQNALFNYDFNNGGMPSVYYAIANAMPEDYASLMNLIPRVDEKTKYLVLNKLNRLAPMAMPTINIDSLDYFDDEDIEKSFKDMHGKIKVELNFNKDELAKEMDELAKELGNMKMKIKIDTKKMAEDIKKEMANLKIELINLGNLSDTNEMKIYLKGFDQEEFKKDMEKMRIELNENLGKMAEELKKNSKEWEKNSEEWEKNSEEWEKNSKEWEEYGKKWEKWGEEFGKNFTPGKFNFKFDSLNIKIEGLEDLEQLEELKIDTTKGKKSLHFKFDRDKKDNMKKDKKKNNEDGKDDEDKSEEI